jgi:hypothetical protein
MLFSLPPGTEMFHFPGFPPHALYIQARVTPHDGCRVPPFGHPRIKALSATPRGLSRPDTSFIGSWYQGIHRAPLNTYTQRTNLTRCFSQLLDARIHYPVHKHPTEPHTHPRPTSTTSRSPMYVSGVDPEPKKPTTHENPNHKGPDSTVAVPSGPNSVPATRPKPGRLSTMFPPMSSVTTRSVVERT